jgi:hypothetical protein
MLLVFSCTCVRAAACVCAHVKIVWRSELLACVCMRKLVICLARASRHRRLLATAEAEGMTCGRVGGRQVVHEFVAHACVLTESQGDRAAMLVKT